MNTSNALKKLRRRNACMVSYRWWNSWSNLLIHSAVDNELIIILITTRIKLITCT